MQARLIRTLLATAALAAAATAFVTSAAAQGRLAAPETTRAASGANGGIWKTSDGHAGAQPAARPNVQTRPSEASSDYLLRIQGVDGESDPPPPPPESASAQPSIAAPGAHEAALLVPAVQRLPRETAGLAPAAPTMPTDVIGSAQGIVPEMPICAHCSSDVAQQSAPAPAAEPDQGLQSDQAAPAALLAPAVQQVRIAAARPRARDPQMDGVVVLATEPAAAAPSDPEMPICGHCGSDVTQTAAEPTQPAAPRRRGGFSISIGGVSIGSGGVRVATGDINGSGNDHTAPQGVRRQHGAIRPVRESGGH